jgi:HK97 family phage portal protein
MGWNSPKDKSLKSSDSKQIAFGAPISANPGLVHKPYRDSWDIERAYREGMSKITWVNRCIDAIAGNQARLPVILRKDNSNKGEIIVGKEANRSTLLELLNTRANVGENSFIFRYRLSAQLLLGTRGAFIEKIRGRDGGIIALNLLPPQATAPIPHPKTFVSGYEVAMPYGEKVILKPEDVCWIRRPHPLDPYLSLTPLEAACVAIEIENLAKLYNRNYLLNDGRPGGLLVVRGEIDEDDKEELKSRFRGNLSKTGHTTVIAADDGVDFVDTSASPRDAAYIQMRQVTKEEILAAFGVPESVIGNAAGRTFSNAAEEIRVFWMETMLPHLEPIARALDELDDKNYVDFDTSEVPILQLYKQERDRYLLTEFQAGLISGNEYRIGSSRKEVESDLADSLLANPNLIPIANTKKKMDENAAMVPGAAPGMPGAPGMPPIPGMPPMPGQAPPMENIPLDPNTMQGAMAEVTQTGELAQSTLPPEAAALQTGAAPTPPGALTAESGEMQYKSAEPAVEDRTETSIERWSEILSRGIERILERQQRVVLEKSGGSKARKGLMAGTLDIDSILSIDSWNKQFEDDLKPVVSAIINDSHESKRERMHVKGLSPRAIPPLDFLRAVDSHVANIKKINEQTAFNINEIMLKSFVYSDEERRFSSFRQELIEMYANLLAKEHVEIAEEETRRAWNFAQF